MEWDKGKLVKATVQSKVGGECRIKYSGKIVTQSIEQGGEAEIIFE